MKKSWKQFFIAAMFMSGCFLASAQNEESISKKTPLNYQLYLGLGAQFSDLGSLGTLLDGDAEKFGNISLASDFEGLFGYKNYLILIGAQTSAYNEVNDKDALEMRGGTGRFGLGYRIKLSDKFDLIPSVAYGHNTSFINYTKSEGINYGSAETFASGPGDSYRLVANRGYVHIGLSTTYRTTSNTDKVQGYFRLIVDYRQAISSTEWTNAFDKEISGPDLIDNSLYAGIGVGIRVL